MKGRTGLRGVVSELTLTLKVESSTKWNGELS